MGSDRERPEQKAFHELHQLVRHLADELAGFRRRALQAESRVKDLEEAAGAVGGGALPVQKVGELERENAELRARLESASDRTRQMLDRLRFLRQQHERGAER